MNVNTLNVSIASDIIQHLEENLLGSENKKRAISNKIYFSRLREQKENLKNC